MQGRKLSILFCIMNDIFSQCRQTMWSVTVGVQCVITPWPSRVPRTEWILRTCEQGFFLMWSLRRSSQEMKLPADPESSRAWAETEWWEATTVIVRFAIIGGNWMVLTTECGGHTGYSGRRPQYKQSRFKILLWCFACDRWKESVCNELVGAGRATGGETGEGCSEGDSSWQAVRRWKILMADWMMFSKWIKLS